MRLMEHQLILGRCIQAAGGDGFSLLTDNTVHDFNIDPLENSALDALVHSSGFRFTRRVQRSWCTMRTANTASLTLSLLPVEQRRQLVGHWVEAGGGKAFDPTSEAEAFLEFVACHLPDPSHVMSVCRMEQAAFRASEAALQFDPPDLSLLEASTVELRAGNGAAMVRFFAQPQRLFDAIAAKQPLPPLSDLHFPVLFAPGLPKLYRAASEREVAMWDRLAHPVDARLLATDRCQQKAIEEFLSIGAAEVALQASLKASAVYPTQN